MPPHVRMRNSPPPAPPRVRALQHAEAQEDVTRAFTCGAHVRSPRLFITLPKRTA
ncbi:unnamed protein product, partial [Closterium sp. NIES-65]